MKPKVSDIVRDLVAQKKYKSALRYAKSFHLGISGDDRVQMTRAYECMNYPDFFLSIGMDPEEEIRKGIETIVRLYGQTKEKSAQDGLEEILQAIDTVCMYCPEDTLEDNSCCDSCPVRRLYDYASHGITKEGSNED